MWQRQNRNRCCVGAPNGRAWTRTWAWFPGWSVLSIAALRPRLTQWQQLGASYLRWWLRELVSLLPSRWQERVHLGREELVLQIDGTQAALERRGLARSEVLAGFEVTEASDIRPEGLPDPGDARFADTHARCRRVLELTSASGVLVRDILLPQAAASNLARVLEYEMDRHTPFPASRVHFGCRILEQLSATGQIRVRLVVMPREVLDVWLLRLGDWGFYPEAVRASREPGVDLMPAERRRRRGGLPGANVWLLGLIAILLAALVVAPWWLTRDRYMELNAELQRLQPLAMESQDLRERQEELQRELTRLPELKAAYPPLADAMTELARTLPDHTWLTTLQFRDNRLTLHGESDAASSLIALIEGSPYFERTSFAAPVSRDDRGRETFQLTTRLRTMSDLRAARGRIPPSADGAAGSDAPDADTPVPVEVVP